MSDYKEWNVLEWYRTYRNPQRNYQMLNVKISRFWRMKLPGFSVLRISRCIQWHNNITLPKNKIIINQLMINGNMDCKDRCGLDRSLSLERSKDRINAVVFKSSDNFWHVSLAILSQSLSPSLIGLDGPVIIRTSFMVGLHTGTNFPAVSVNTLLAEAMMKTR